MNSLFEKSTNLGLGIFVYSREKVEELVEELVSKGEIAKKDARQFAGELVKKGESQRDELKNMIRNEIEKALNHVNVTKKEDILTKDEISQIVKEQMILMLQEQGIVKNGSLK
ncbi:MAG: hypothetical protein KGZ33_02280 [Alkaliphilus sp.]|nr:hypothetical protein [Alkaliphilus sp.]